MKEVHTVLLETMKEFHSFCEKHELTYYMIGGTLLGAVRGKGFIPWDDDADIAMSRKDYNKLLSLSHLFEHPLSLNSPKNVYHFRWPYSKLTNEKLILKEDSYKPNISGVWIDIFPIDYTFNSRFFQSLHFNIIRTMQRLLNIKYGLVNMKSKPILMRSVLVFLSFVTKLVPRKLINLLITILEIFPSKILKKSEYLANLHGHWGAKEVVPSDIFKGRQLYELERHCFWGPKNASVWLEQVYGDYMKLPPIHERISHNVEIVNRISSK